MGYIIKSKRYKMQDHYKYDVASAEKSTECCPQDPGQAPGPTPAVRGPPPPPPSQPPAPARERATGQPGSSSAEPQPKKKEFRE